MRNTGLRFLLPYMRPYRKLLIIGTLYAIIGASASAFSPTLLGWAIDELTNSCPPAGAGSLRAGAAGAGWHTGAVPLPATYVDGARSPLA